ncbi:putative ORF-2 [uncultured Candidatus Thioglobus sp.]|nr:putative ORF-2 [uncultured Candidatus Thioglobus sp.]SMN02595.1 putative ORF-2 [uncultured Candidatus Thioglobus sp.]
MPTISMFYGIFIRMYYAPEEHPPAHFHAYYAEHKATINIDTCEIIKSNLPKKQSKIVLAWAEIHQDELKQDWDLVMNGKQPFKITPLQ